MFGFLSAAWTGTTAQSSASTLTSAIINRCCLRDDFIFGVPSLLLPLGKHFPMGQIQGRRRGHCDQQSTTFRCLLAIGLDHDQENKG
jgi:hypothetical protein